MLVHRCSHLIGLFLFLILPFGGEASTKRDSLRKVWEEPERVDSVRLKALNELAWAWLRRSPDSAREWCRKGIGSSIAHSDPRSMAVLTNTLGATFYYQSRYDSALKAYKRSVRIFRERTDTSKKQAIIGLASALNNIALIQEEQGNLPQALENFQRSLDLRERAKDSSAIGSSYLNMGELYFERSAIGKAHDLYKKALEIYRELEEQEGVIKAQNNLGMTLRYAPDSLLKKKGIPQEERHLEVLRRYDQVKEWAKGSEDPRMLSTALINIGSSYNDLASAKKEVLKRYAEEDLKLDLQPSEVRKLALDSAMAYAQRSIELTEKLGSYHGKGSAKMIIGRSYHLKGKDEKAISVLEEAYRVFDSLSIFKRVRDVSELLFKAHEREGDHKKALKWHKIHLSAKDSVMDQEKEKKLALLEARHRFREKQRLREARHQKELALAEKEERIQRIISYSSGTGLFLVLLFAYFLFDRLRLTKRQKRTIEEQKAIVEEKQAEIMASIDYASYIQNALLKEEEERSAELPEHFVLFRPKDVVSGDFYWSMVQGGKVWFAVADCTGHGVPGGFLTMLGNSFLNEIVPQQKDPDPATVLDELRDRFVRDLGAGAKDGMDISLICIDHEKKEFQWAGANNPLYWVREGSKAAQDQELQENCKIIEEGGSVLIELPPDKRPIGKSEDQGNFTLRTGSFAPGELFYLLSDGYPDQFGGDKGKKFKYKPLKRLLLELSGQPLKDQRIALEKRLDEWKGQLEQVDDVCLAGVKGE